MQVERNKKARSTGRPIKSLVAVARAGSGQPTIPGWPGGPAGVTGREDIVRVRLRLLLAALGELPTGPPAAAGLAAGAAALPGRQVPAGHPGDAWAQPAQPPARDRAPDRCSTGPRSGAPHFGAVLHGGYTRPLRPGGRPERRCPGSISPWPWGRLGPGDRRPALVRETLRRCYALRSWLAEGRWGGVPVLAAVCGCPAARASAAPWVMIDSLWLGTADHCPAGSYRRSSWTCRPVSSCTGR